MKVTSLGNYDKYVNENNFYEFLKLNYHSGYFSQLWKQFRKTNHTILKWNEAYNIYYRFSHERAGIEEIRYKNFKVKLRIKPSDDLDYIIRYNCTHLEYASVSLNSLLGRFEEIDRKPYCYNCKNRISVIDVEL